MAGEWVSPAHSWLRNTAKLTPKGPSEATPSEIRIRWGLLLTEVEQQILCRFIDWQDRNRGMDGSFTNSFAQSRTVEGTPLTQEQVTKHREDALAKLGYEWGGMNDRPRKRFYSANQEIRELLHQVCLEHSREEELAKELEFARGDLLVTQNRANDAEREVRKLEERIESLRTITRRSADFSPEGLRRILALFTDNKSRLLADNESIHAEVVKISEELTRLREEAEQAGRATSEARPTIEQLRTQLAELATTGSPDEIVALARKLKETADSLTASKQRLDDLRSTINEWDAMLAEKQMLEHRLKPEIDLLEAWIALAERTLKFGELSLAQPPASPKNIENLSTSSDEPVLHAS